VGRVGDRYVCEVTLFSTPEGLTVRLWMERARPVSAPAERGLVEREKPWHIGARSRRPALSAVDDTRPGGAH
jgi:hypothetical protein